ncbi:alpha-L-fucosidase [Luteimonas panaciterrae]|uniref:alpha-L-fucosidase n=1 Tax=Luteimonas panaciterrae TaxID=363885 RepID=UPI001CFA89C1|nr:alpha-L-fucosidase [Luteimonas panaciterrae]
MKLFRKVFRFAFVLMLACTGAAQAANDDARTHAQADAVQWFQDARFGLFIHWGVYSVPGRGEWVMENEKIPIAEYEKFATRFNPEKFDAKAIVDLAKRAGMKYITITSKHHDGFAMWPTKQSRWNIADATKFKRDPLKELADEAHRQGIKLFFYYSQLDWHHPDFSPLGKTGQAAGRKAGGDFNRYLDYMDAQLTELLTNYGEIGGIWFDGMWDKPDADWRLGRTYDLIHRLQPSALVGSNHHKAPYPGEDFQMFEKDLPGANTAGFNTAHISRLPLEACDTINGAWGYNAKDHSYKSSKELIHFLVRAAGAGSNFLLNIGPTPEGTVQPEFVERLEQVGRWLQTNGASIYGTRAGPVPPRSWGVTTEAKDGTVYVHVLEWQDEYLLLPPLQDIASASAFGSGETLELRRLPEGLIVKLPKASADQSDRIVVLKRSAQPVAASSEAGAHQD